MTLGSFPASLVAHTLVTLDSNYPELAAEVHVVNVWWLVKRGLTALLEATSASTRRRVRIYRNDDTGAEKLGIRWEKSSSTSVFVNDNIFARWTTRGSRTPEGTVYTLLTRWWLMRWWW